MSNFEIKIWELLGRNSLGILLFLGNFPNFPKLHNFHPQLNTLVKCNPKIKGTALEGA